MLITVQQNPSWQLSLAQLSPSLSSKLSIYVRNLSNKTWSLKCSTWKGFDQSLVFEENLDDVVLMHENFNKFSMVSR